MTGACPGFFEALLPRGLIDFEFCVSAYAFFGEHETVDQSVFVRPVEPDLILFSIIWIESPEAIESFSRFG